MKISEQQWNNLITGQISYLGEVPTKPVLFPGSFNPVHDGHREMARIAEEILGRSICPEISVNNVDKATLDRNDLMMRANQARKLGKVVATSAPRFVEKAKLFRDTTFVIGADTALRLDDPKYYQNKIDLRDQSIEEIACAGGKFLVFGRLVGEIFEEASKLQLSSKVRSMCTFVPSTTFRQDISSTDIRTGKRNRRPNA